MPCFQGENDLCWVCGLAQCPFHPITKPEQLTLFAIENLHKCGDCQHLMDGICAIKSHEQGADVHRFASQPSCYGFVQKL